MRIDGIDLLRGLSIFFVLMNHVHMRLFLAKIPYSVDLPSQLVSSLVWNGQRGVQIFFCISGFLIASTSIRRWGSLAQVKVLNFYWLRVARIIPLFAALLAILCLLHFVGDQDFVVSEKTGGLRGALTAALTFRVNVLEANLGYLPANWDILWSLSVEEMFYLFFPIVCIFLGRSKFLFGVLTAVLAARIRYSNTTLRWTALTGAILLIFALGFTRATKQLGLNSLGLDMTVLAIGTCLLLLAAAQTRWQASHWLSPVLKLGERSYEIYLTHMFVIFAFFRVFLWLGSPTEMIPVLFIVSILISAFLGEIVARLYSEPLNSMLRKQRKMELPAQVEVAVRPVRIK